MPQEVTSARYGVVYYKKSKSIGVKSKFGATNRRFSFGGLGHGLSESVLRGWADDVLRKLSAGEGEKDVKAWVVEAIRPSK